MVDLQGESVAAAKDRNLMLPRRLVLTAAVSVLASPALAAPVCRGRKPYMGGALHAPLDAAIWDQAARGGADRLSAAVSGDLDARFAKARGLMPVRALTAAVAAPEGQIWTASTAEKLSAPFFWASVGKAYTATAVLQLAEEGRLSLDAPMSRWFPDMPNASAVTLEDLLAHTSGIYSFQADPELRAAPGYKAPAQLLATAARHPADFCPGEAWSYSNTGYVLLGQILEAVEDRPYHEVVTARVVDRLGLTETVIMAPRTSPPGLVAPAPAQGQASGTDDDPTTPYAAGGVAASAADVVRFWRGLLGGRLHSAPMLRRRFARLYPMFGGRTEFYGLGVMVTDLGAADPRSHDVWLGHDGGLPGAKATMIYSVEKRAFAAVALTGEGSPQATANLLLQALSA
jgi:D-alanyl-D-alanine carboxypeptidase